METSEHIEGTIESILFVSDKPVTLEEFKDVLETVSSADIKEAITNLQKEYTQKNRGMVIAEIAGGYQMLSSPHYAMAIRRFYKTTHKEKLSKPSLETLAIIAYKQPVARIDIELIRGVNSDGVVSHLLLKGLIKIVGRKEVPGRPFIYGTTQQFLEYFGLKSLEDLPKLEEFSPEATQNLSFPNALVGNPNEVIAGPPTKTFGGDTDPLVEPSEKKIKKEVETFLQQAQGLSPAEDTGAFQRNVAEKPQSEEESLEVFSSQEGKG